MSASSNIFLPASELFETSPVSLSGGGVDSKDPSPGTRVEVLGSLTNLPTLKLSGELLIILPKLFSGRVIDIGAETLELLPRRKYFFTTWLILILWEKNILC